MDGRQQTVAHLRAGNCMRLALVDLSFAEGHEIVDGLQVHVGLPLERREMFEADQRLLIVWVRGMSVPPIVRQMEGRGYGPQGLAPA